MVFLSPRLWAFRPSLLSTTATSFLLLLNLFLFVLCLAPSPVTGAAVTISSVSVGSALHQARDPSVTPGGDPWKCWEECVGEGGDADYCEEICWNRRRRKDDIDLLGDKKLVAYGQGSPTRRGRFYNDGKDDEDACWEECTGNEGADAEYCEDICRNHGHGGGDDENDGGDEVEDSVTISAEVVKPQGGNDEDTCWEECTSKEGADAEYCEEICRKHSHYKKPGDGNKTNGDEVLANNPWTSDSYSGVDGYGGRDDDEDACWEECTGKEGADADYCEEICRNHDHGHDDDEGDDDGDDFRFSSQKVLDNPGSLSDNSVDDDCWEESDGPGGADDLEYCEDICQKHDIRSGTFVILRDQRIDVGGDAPGSGEMMHRN